MAAVEWIRFLAGAFLLLMGLGIFVIEMIGIFRFQYVLNRMHAAAMGDTLGIGFSLAGLILMNGMNFTSLKLLFVIVFLWFASPVSSHLIARLEVTTDEEKEKHYRVMTLKELEEEHAKAAEAEKTAKTTEAATAAETPKTTETAETAAEQSAADSRRKRG
ncbi:MAG: monovalent cation/H(+) antiporter subunit G [Candidatus Limivivens sp.]|nr:monovalent cation/H(+) antiporter subunit G [Candidatus Limivivens sp.]